MIVKDFSLSEQLKYCQNKAECEPLIKSFESAGLVLVNVGGFNGSDCLQFVNEEGYILVASLDWLDEGEIPITEVDLKC